MNSILSDCSCSTLAVKEVPFFCISITLQYFLLLFCSFVYFLVTFAYSSLAATLVYLPSKSISDCTLCVRYSRLVWQLLSDHKCIVLRVQNRIQRTSPLSLLHVRYWHSHVNILHEEDSKGLFVYPITHLYVRLHKFRQKSHVINVSYLKLLNLSLAFMITSSLLPSQHMNDNLSIRCYRALVHIGIIWEQRQLRLDSR